MPRAHYTVDEESKFVNPYNFVPLGKECTKRINSEELPEPNNLLTGWISCTLTTKSPIFIPDTPCEKTEDGDNFYFYSRFSKPVIPGSELRGMFRSAFEAVTNSCMSSINSKEKFYKRTIQSGNLGKIFKKDEEWYIQPCERIGIAAWKKYGKTPNKRKDGNDFSEKIKRLEEGALVRFTKSANPYTKQTKKGERKLFYYVESIGGPQEGFIHKGEPIESKHHETIFVPQKRAKPISLSPEELDNFIDNVNLYGKMHEKDSPHSGYDQIKAGKREDLNGALVYYHIVDDKKYLSPAAIGREVFYKSWEDLLGSFKPCTNKKELCPACALFGFVSGTESIAGRLRFGDAAYTGKDYLSEVSYNSKENELKIPEMSSPKPSATEFYLERPGDGKSVDLWNYDYAGSWKKEFSPCDDYHARMRGRKFYWHNLKESYKFAEDMPRTIKIHPLKSGKKFSFKVYFNNIGESELEKLLWVLTIGFSEEHGHKIGMGKPLGFGSIRVDVENVISRKVCISEDGAIEYKLKCDKDVLKKVKEAGTDIDRASKLLGCDKNVLDAFLRMTELEPEFSKNKIPIDYPRLTGNENQESFRWFVANKQINSKSPGSKKPSAMRPKVDQVLPQVQDPTMCKIKDTSSSTSDSV